jgi:hypothetical protein
MSQLAFTFFFYAQLRLVYFGIVCKKSQLSKITQWKQQINVFTSGMTQSDHIERLLVVRKAHIKLFFHPTVYSQTRL